MTIQAPFHRQWLVAPGQRHCAHVSVTAKATDAFVDMDAVIEVDVVRQVVNTIPTQRLTISKTIPHWSQHGRLIPEFAMTVHANLGRRQTGAS